MGETLDYADRLWRGEDTITSGHQLFAGLALEECTEGVAFLPTFANVSAFSTGDGLFLVDTGSEMFASTIHGQIRGWSDKPLHTAVYSHGHVDHVFGIPVFAAEAAEKGWRAPQVVAHEALPQRFDRYKMTAGYNAVINRRQFQVPNLQWPMEYRYPDITYRDSMTLVVGGMTIDLHHARGETDDHTWTWVPEKKVLCSGDLFIWASPNAGNPQKVQRYPIEWARALRKMAALNAEFLLPGHGVPVVGADRIKTALLDTAALLESLHEQTVAMMNEGARLDEIIHTVKAPAELLDKPYLRPVYDEPEFIVRNVWRLYGGWYDGNPASLKPAPDAVVASELAALAGGASALASRASELAAAGDEDSLRLAGHLAEIAALAEPDDAGVHRVRAEVFGARTEFESSTMAKGVFGWAAAESRKKSEVDGT
ncbi:MAG TPA: alkyl sulfatase dimerization domain-containing protein [Jatrophihabitantaceae bacterium]|nr:alkyl sulfatase dimerization domain-containing protein [Jatrophihabitantaceae bacterium]